MSGRRWPQPWFVYTADGRFTQVLVWPDRVAWLPWRRWPA